MATERHRQQLLLGALVIVLGVVLYRVWPSTAPSAAPAAASNQQGARTRATSPSQGQASSSSPAAPDVHLDALQSGRPKPGQTERVLFRFKPKAPPAPPARPVAPPTATAPANPV